MNFEQAVKEVTKLNKEPGNDDKLYLYARYKQATVGPCNTERPGFFDPVGRAKWDAWNAVKDTTGIQAEMEYTAKVQELIANDPQ